MADIGPHGSEVALHAANERWGSVQREIIELIGADAPLPTVLDLLASAIDARVVGTMTIIHLIDASTGQLTTAAAPGMPEKGRRALSDLRIGRSVGAIGAAAHWRQPVVVKDIATDSRWASHRAVPLSMGLEASWSSPIPGREGALLGVMTLFRRDTRVPTSNDWSVIGDAVRLARLAVERVASEVKQHTLTRERRADRELLNAVVRQMPIGVMVVEAPSGAVLLGNDAVTELLRGPANRPADVSAHASPNQIAAELTATLATRTDWPLARSIATGETILAEDIDVVRADGSHLVVRVSSAPVRGDDGAIVAGVCTFGDVTEALQAESALRASEARYRSLALATNDTVREWDIARNVVTWTEPLFSSFRHPVNDEAQRIEWWSEHVHADDRARVLGSLQRAVESEETSWSAEYRFLCGDNSVAHVFDRGAILRDETGVAIRMISSMMDLTARVELDTRLQQSNRMETVGQLAGGIAHDFNNVLTAILTSAQLTLDGLPLGHVVRGEVLEIQHAAERAASLTRQLLTFSRRQVVQPELLDVNQLLSEGQAIWRRVIDANIHVMVRLDPKVQRVRADRRQLEQVFLDLVVNARDAMPGGGALTVTSANVTLGEATVPALAAGPYVAISFRDTGVGMSDDTRAHMFEPFYTTKCVGQGTGLGLATVYGIVEQVGGSIQVTSAPGAGTTMQILLPAVTVPREAESRGGDAHDTHGDETILLVEDEPLVRSLLRRTLRHQGYQVLEAANGEEALQLFGQHDGEIDMLLTDIMMPGMSGIEVATRVRSRNAWLPVLFISGYAKEAIRVDGAMLPNTRFLGKPFLPNELLTSVRETLDSASVRSD